MEPAQSKTNYLIKFVVNQDLKTSLDINGYVLAAILIAVVVVIVVRVVSSLRMRRFEIDETEFGLGNQKIKLRPNIIDMQIAYKIWVELSTRKIGLPIDFDHDVISEVYDSWYGFFAVTRDLIKEVPVTRFRRSDTEKIIRLSIEVLNSGIRPHLTKWQARFRRWYEHEMMKEENLCKAPQEIQAIFPEYKELAADLKIVNKRLIQYRQKMHELIT